MRTSNFSLISFRFRKIEIFDSMRINFTKTGIGFSCFPGILCAATISDGSIYTQFTYLIKKAMRRSFPLFFWKVKYFNIFSLSIVHSSLTIPLLRLHVFPYFQSLLSKACFLCEGLRFFLKYSHCQILHCLFFYLVQIPLT